MHGGFTLLKTEFVCRPCDAWGAQDKIEQKRNKYSKEMLKDAKEFSRLQAQKEREYQNFLAAIEKIKQDHKNEILFEAEQHKKEMDYK